MAHFIVLGHLASHVQRYIHQPSLYRHRNIRFPWYTAKWPFCTISIRTRCFISERCSKWAILRGQNGAKMAPPFPNEQALRKQTEKGTASEVVTCLGQAGTSRCDVYILAPWHLFGGPPLNKRLTTPRKLGGIRRVPPVSAHKLGPSLGEGSRAQASRFQW